MAFTGFRSLVNRRRRAPKPAGHGERGFGLVESLLSVGIAATGLLAVAGLLAAGANLQRTSRDGGRSGMAAMQTLERLRVLPVNDLRVSLGGSLTADVNNHNAMVTVAPAGQVRVRWLVQAGPAGTLDITVRAEPVVAGGRPSVVRSLVWR
jgi:Tfp pilus assembly protein PilV